jgi:flagellum-specific peptidoglycan hydrolase FlgJ
MNKSKVIDAAIEHAVRSENWLLTTMSKNPIWAIVALAFASAFFMAVTTDGCKMVVGNADSMSIGTATAADAEALDVSSVHAFIATFDSAAKAEQRLNGIPYSVTMGQAIIESHAGKSNLYKKTANAFGIKCFNANCPKGHCVVYHDDKPNDRFIVYSSPFVGFRDHSNFLKKDRYKSCFKTKDYKNWAKGLKANGYATDPDYDKKLIGVAEKYKLYELDK